MTQRWASKQTTHSCSGGNSSPGAAAGLQLLETTAAVLAWPAYALHRDSWHVQTLQLPIVPPDRAASAEAHPESQTLSSNALAATAASWALASSL